MPTFNVFQIYYNETTRLSLDPGFSPLDNTKNERPDWYELWVIRNFLRNNQVSENDWYGFLSPQFGRKTGLTAPHVYHFLELSKNRGEVGLILAEWDQVAYFLNPFEQGEIWHPGIAALSQSAFHELGHKGSLSDLVTFSGNFTFCNYIIAKPTYWREWLRLADGLFDLIENKTTELAESLRRTTSYGSILPQAPMKAFIQERLPAIILADRKFQTCTLNSSSTLPVSDSLFKIDHATRGVLQTCDMLKQRFHETGDARFLELFRDIRQLIALRFPRSMLQTRVAAQGL
jgi:hypothetical protein